MSDYLQSGAIDIRQCTAGCEIKVGALIRGRTRMVLQYMKDFYEDKVQISFYEDKGFLSSTFSVTIRGPYCDVIDVQNRLKESI